MAIYPWETLRSSPAVPVIGAVLKKVQVPLARQTAVMDLGRLRRTRLQAAWWLEVERIVAVDAYPQKLRISRQVGATIHYLTRRSIGQRK